MRTLVPGYTHTHAYTHIYTHTCIHVHTHAHAGCRFASLQMRACGTAAAAAAAAAPWCLRRTGKGAAGPRRPMTRTRYALTTPLCAALASTVHGGGSPTQRGVPPAIPL
eukprot:GHVU01012809.1.p2 GENE.GHVU01012809.1~~GHVU01012809.1.p2  ORF type:complete len:109 (+),score=7.47 GHVU01012809.1:340-666(+)